MDFQVSLACQVFRDEIMALGVHGPQSILKDFPLASVNSFDDLGSLLAKNMLLGDDGVAVMLAHQQQQPSTIDSKPSELGAVGTSSTAPPAVALQRYFQLHALTWPNALVRALVPKSGGGEEYRVGVVRSVSVSVPKASASTDSASRAAALSHPTGPSDSLFAFVGDYLSKMVFLRVDFGNTVEEKLPVRLVSNDAFTAGEFTTLSSAVISSHGQTFTNPASALEFFFKEAPSTTQMRLYSCRLVSNASGGKGSSSSSAQLLPKRTYPQSLLRTFASTEPLNSFGGLYLTRAVQQLFALEQGASALRAGDGTAVNASVTSEETDEALGVVVPEGSDAAGVGGAEEEEEQGTLTYKELSALLNGIIAPQLERLHELIVEQSLSSSSGGASSTQSLGLGASSGGSAGGMAQLEDSRREVYRVQQLLKETREKCARLQSELDQTKKDLAAEKTNVRNSLLESAKLTKAVETWRTRALDNRSLLVEARSMLKMNENAGPEEVLQALRRKLPSQ